VVLAAAARPPLPMGVLRFCRCCASVLGNLLWFFFVFLHAFLVLSCLLSDFGQCDQFHR
jgi:hypothetical protein